MSFPVYFKNVNKRENSNDAFSIVGMTGVDCILKAGTSLTHPVLEIQTDNTTDVVTYSQYNECYIPSFSRYYFIRDWTMKGRKIICSCEVDVLASFWDDFKSQSFYIARSSQFYTSGVPDTVYPTKGGYTSYQYTQTSPLAAYSADPANPNFGCFVVGVINRNGGVGGIDYYIMGYLAFIQFALKLFNISNFGSFTGIDGDITEDVAKIMINPFQYITQCFWLPFKLSDVTALGYTQSTTSVYLGYWSLAVGTTIYYLDNDRPALTASVIIKTEMTVHKHPDAAARGSYLNLAPYSKYSLYYYPFGMIDLDPLELCEYASIYALTSIDLRSGMGILQLCHTYTGTNSTNYATASPFKVVQAQVGVEIGVASLKYYVPSSVPQLIANVAVGSESYGGFIGLMDKLAGSAWHGVSDLAETFGMGGEWSEAMKSYTEESGKMISGGDLSKIASSALTARNTAECLGMTGAISFMDKQMFTLIHTYLYQVPENLNDNGRPTCTIKTLTDFTSAGFIMCSNAHPKVSRATITEKRMITNYLNSGFYVVASGS